jgi:hypothetical protein
MKKKMRKDIVRYKNKLRKQQLDKEQTGADVAEDDCGISEESENRLKQKLREMSGIDHEIIRDSTLEKMSDVLVDYAKPFLDTIDTDNKEEYEKVIMMAIIFWNRAITEGTIKGHKKIKELLKPIMSGAKSRKVVRYMLERKRQMYPDNKRVILNYELTEVPDGGFHLSVVSSVDDAAAAKYINSAQDKANLSRE